MAHERRFSEVAVAYNQSLANLNTARDIFEKELDQLIAGVLDHLETVIVRHNKDEQIKDKMRWADPEDQSRKKDGPWINYTAAASVALDIRPPTAKNFKKGAAYLTFECVFDANGGNKFVFRCRLDNQNSVFTELDEKVFELIKTKADGFPKAEHIKSDVTILFSRDLEDSLFADINQHIDSSLAVCQEAVDVLIKLAAPAQTVPVAPPTPADENKVA